MTKWRMVGSVQKDDKWVYDAVQAEKDMAAIEILHAEQVEQFGLESVGDLPEMDKFPVWLALVCERKGKVIGAWYGEMILEGCMIGCDPKATALLKRSAPGLIERFKRKGIRLLRTFVPKGADLRIGKELGRVGFRNQDEMYEHYLLDMR